jgi:cell division septum initiation protein DivIVA
MSELATPVKRMEPISLTSIPAFPQSRKGGYVEERVDEFLKGFVADANRLIEALNNAKEGIAERDQKIVELQSANYDLANQAPAAATVLDEGMAERSARLFGDAQSVAQRFLADAKADAGKIIADAQANAEAIRVSLEEETASAVATRDQVVADRDEIISRLEGLYLTQLDVLRTAKTEGTANVGSLTPENLQLERDFLANPEALAAVDAYHTDPNRLVTEAPAAEEIPVEADMPSEPTPENAVDNADTASVNIVQ